MRVEREHIEYGVFRIVFVKLDDASTENHQILQTREHVYLNMVQNESQNMENFNIEKMIYEEALYRLM